MNGSREVIKEFLETNYPRGRAIGVFRWFHFDLKVKNRLPPEKKRLRKKKD